MRISRSRRPRSVCSSGGGCGSKSGAETGICAFGGAPRCPGLFSLRPSYLLSNNSCANRLLSQTPPPSNPFHIRCNEKRRRKHPSSFSVAQRQGLSSPLWRGRGRCFSERLDGFTAAGVRSHEPTAGPNVSHSRTVRRLWFKPCAPKKDEVISPRLFLAQRQGFEPW